MGTFFTGIRGAYKSAVSLTNQASGPTSNLGLAVGGANDKTNSPFAYFPVDLHSAMNEMTVGSMGDPMAIVCRGGATDGTASEWFQTLTNSGTITNLGTQAGYQGLPLSTTGASSGNQNAYIATPSFFPTTGKYAVMYGRFYFADPNVHAYSFAFGFGNKQADPIGTAFTDGSWVQGSTSSGAIAFVGKTRTASGTATTTATVGTIASGVPRSVELAVVMVGQGTSYFLTRDPTVATNAWSVVSTALTPAAGTVLMRPHFVHYCNTGNTNAVHIGMLGYWFERNLAF